MREKSWDQVARELHVRPFLPSDAEPPRDVLAKELMKVVNSPRPMGEKLCAICELEPVGTYPYQVCSTCDGRAVTAAGGKWKGHSIERIETGVRISPPDDEPNPIFIDGVKCWRRYRFGGWVTMRDVVGASTLREFYDRTRGSRV